MLELTLFPRPRIIRLSGEASVGFDGPPELHRDPSLPEQGYALEATRGGVRLRYRDDAGKRYGQSTLSQLRAHRGPLPSLEIQDWPDFPVRGYMLDISRDRVPTRATLERTVELLDQFRINHLELYTEHTFAFRDHQPVWRDASPMTAEDLSWLDTLCRERGIELCANQNTFGHMGRWLGHAEYAQRAETPGGWDGPFGHRLEPSVLAPTPANAEFALALVREMMENVSSRRVNIGCDETFELGQGVSRAAVEARGRGAVYVEHLLRLLRGLHQEGCEVLFWGDILREHPERVAALPSEQTVALAWWYEAPLDDPEIPESLRDLVAQFGISEEAQRGFSGQVPAFANAGLPFWVCPGTSAWNSLIGRWPNARANLLDAVDVGLDQGASGCLITDWGDNGHIQPPSVSWLPLAFGAAQAWCASANRDVDIAAALDAVVFGDPSGELGATLVSLGEAYLGTGRTAVNASALFTAIVSGPMLLAFGEPDPNELERTLGRLEDASAGLRRARPSCADGDVVLRELEQAVRLARHGAHRLLASAGRAGFDAQFLERERVEAKEEQAVCWRLRSREGGLAESLARLDPQATGNERA